MSNPNSFLLFLFLYFRKFIVFVVIIKCNIKLSTTQCCLAFLPHKHSVPNWRLGSVNQRFSVVNQRISIVNQRFRILYVSFAIANDTFPFSNESFSPVCWMWVGLGLDMGWTMKFFNLLNFRSIPVFGLDVGLKAQIFQCARV